eukprot:471176-Rhodomonas_salina.2
MWLRRARQRPDRSAAVRIGAAIQAAALTWRDSQRARRRSQGARPGCRAGFPWRCRRSRPCPSPNRSAQD